MLKNCQTLKNLCYSGKISPKLVSLPVTVTMDAPLPMPFANLASINKSLVMTAWIVLK